MKSLRSWSYVTAGVLILTGLLLLTRSGHEHDVARQIVRLAPRSLSTAPQQYAPSTNSENGIFHLVLLFSSHGKELCRTVASAMALGYPIPTLLQLDPPEPVAASLAAGFDMKLEALDSFREGRDDDLVLIMDGSNSWFQMRPQVLLSRYFQLEMSSKLSETIVFPGQHSDLDEGCPVLANMDAMFGTIKTLRDFLTQAKELVTSGLEFSSTHQVYSQLIRRQQAQALRQQSAEDASLQHPAERRNFRFNLDLISSADAKLPKGTAAKGLIKDLRNSKPPFWSMVDDDLPNAATWANRPLRVNKQGNVIPAIVMHRSGGNETAKEWSRTWFSRSLVPLYRVQRQMPISPVAYAGGQFWWPHRPGSLEYEVIIKGAQRYMDEDSVCGGSFEETLSGR